MTCNRCKETEAKIRWEIEETKEHHDWNPKIHGLGRDCNECAKIKALNDLLITLGFEKKKNQICCACNKKFTKESGKIQNPTGKKEWACGQCALEYNW